MRTISPPVQFLLASFSAPWTRKLAVFFSLKTVFNRKCVGQPKQVAPSNAVWCTRAACVAPDAPMRSG